MKKLLKIFLALFPVACCSCNKNPETLPETLIVEGLYDEQEMDIAMAHAQREVDSFIEELSKGNGTNFAVKAFIEDEDKSEYIWVDHLTYSNGEFQGLIGNEPGIVGNVKFGQKWTVKKSDVSDWMFFRDEKMHGNYTIKGMPW